MLKRFILTSGLLVLILHAGNAMSAEFQPIGFEAISMGGAGVAAAKGSYATYYNPALLAVSRYGGEVTLSPGIGAREINLVDHIDALSDIDIDATFNSLGGLDFTVDGSGNVTVGPGTDTSLLQSNFAKMQNELRALAQKNGLQLMPNLAFGVQVGNFGTGVFGMAEATAYAEIDENRLDVIVQETYTGSDYYVEYDVANDTFTEVSQSEYESRSIEYAVNPTTGDPSTYMDLTGIGYAEIPLGYGHQINSPLGRICVGGAVKVLVGNTYEAKIDIDTASDDITDAIKDSEKKDTTWGVDLGMLYSPPGMNSMAFGLVGKNLNKPEFSTRLGRDLDIDPQIRAGFAWDILADKLTFALDMDLSKNESFIANYDTRYIGGGVNFHPFSWMSLRGGLMKNLEESDEGTILTSGLGLGTKWMQVDLSGQFSTESGEFDGQDIPRYVRVQLAVVSRWN